MSRLLIVAKGSFGDVFPLFAVARALQERGHQVTFAVPEKHLANLAALELEALPLPRPPAAATAGLPGWLRRPLDRILSINNAGLEREYDALAAAAATADLIVGNQIAFVAGILAECLGKPWVYCAISPLAVYSAADPPSFPGLHALPGRPGPLRARLEYHLARMASRPWGRDMVRLRRQRGLPDRGHPLFEGKFSPHLNLFLCSPELAPPQADWPDHTYQTGFCWLEPDFLGRPGDRAALADFLARGPAPVVLTLGSDSRSRPGRFYDIGIQACRRLGLRAILVADPRLHDSLPRGDDLLVTGFLPYSCLAPAALAVVHSAGIGTLGWCLRHGTPSIVSPGAEDQFDNARRAERLGIASLIPRPLLTADRLAATLASLVDARGAWPDAATRAVAREDGAAAACLWIETLLGGSGERR